MYPADLVMPMKAELTDKGFQDLTSAEQVNDALKKPGTTLVMVNSVCGCAAGAARPGVIYSLTGKSAYRWSISETSKNRAILQTPCAS